MELCYDVWLNARRGDDNRGRRYIHTDFTPPSGVRKGPQIPGQGPVFVFRSNHFNKDVVSVRMGFRYALDPPSNPYDIFVGMGVDIRIARVGVVLIVGQVGLSGEMDAGRDEHDDYRSLNEPA